MSGLPTIDLNALDTGKRRHSASRLGLWAKRAAWVLLPVLLAVAVFSPEIKAYLQAAAILIECNGTPAPRILRLVLESTIRSERVSIPTPDGPPIAAILYTPAGRPNAPGLVLVPGLDPGGMKGISEFAHLEASTGLRVLTPDLPQLSTYNVYGLDESAVVAIGESTKWLAGRTGHPVSLMGISFGGGLTLVAAAKKEYASSVRLDFDVGGYDSLERVLRFYMTGIDIDPDGKSRNVKPSRWVQNFLEYGDLAELGSKQDIRALEPILQARILYQQHHPRNEANIISGMIARLNPEEKSKLDVFLDENLSRQEFGELLNKIAPQMRQVSPHDNLEGLTAKVYILHGLNDDVIPSSEALWLQRDIPRKNLKAMLITPLLSHVSLKGHDHAWKDKWRILNFMYKVQRAELAAE